MKIMVRWLAGAAVVWGFGFSGLMPASGFTADKYGPEEIVNGGLENWSSGMAEDWARGGKESNSSIAEETSGVYEGKSAAKITVDQDNSFIALTPKKAARISAPGGTTYKFSCWAKGEKGGEGFYLMINEDNPAKSGAQSDTDRHNWLQGTYHVNGAKEIKGWGDWGTSVRIYDLTTDWQKVEFFFTTSPDSTYIRLERVGARNNAGNVYWIDDISIRKVTGSGG